MKHLALVNALSEILNFEPFARKGSSPDEGLRRAKQLVSSRTGIIASVEFQHMRAGEPPVFWAHSCPPQCFQGTQLRIQHHGFGVSTDGKRAAMKSIGESIERYCAVPPPASELLYGNYRTLKLKVAAQNPEKLTFFSSLQFQSPRMPFARLTSDCDLHWVQGISLVTGEEVYVPAFLVFVPWPLSTADYRPEKRYAHSISTGLACGPTFETAIYRGLLEVIERDAFMLSWRHQRQMPSLDRNIATQPLSKSLLRVMDKLPVSMSIKNATIDIPVNVVLVSLTSRTGNFPQFAMGAGADFDQEFAFTLAMEEALLCYCGLSRVEYPEAINVEDELANGINPLALHGLAHATQSVLRSSRRCLEDATASSTEQGFENPRTTGELVRRLAAQGYEAIGVDLTSPDVDAAGFKVTRVLVPGLQPLDIDQRWPYLGPQRINSHTDAEAELHDAIRRLPHPFA